MPKPPSDAARRAGSNRLRAWALAAGLVAAVTIVHVWILSAGKMTGWPLYGAYYSLQADAFIDGHTYLRIRPHPALLALPDPYDPQANLVFRRNFNVHDMVLYGDKFYLYWGPLPALALVPVKLWLAADPSELVGDQYVVFVAAAGVMVFGTLLLLRLRDRLFPEQPWWTVAFGVLAAGLVNPMPFMLARASVYEGAILSGQCFLLAGLCALSVAFAGTSRKVELGDEGVTASARPPMTARGVVCLAAAGLCMAAAVGSRPSLAIAVAALAAATAWRTWRQGRNGLWGMIAFGVPLAAGAVLFAAYNHARFGSWSEFGPRYQLGGIPMKRIGDRLFSGAYLLPGLYTYLVRPLKWAAAFPHVYAQPGIFPSWIRLPPDYFVEEDVAGLLIASPVFLLALVGAGMAAARIRTRIRGTTSPPQHKNGAEVRWETGCLWAAALLGFAPSLLTVGSTMRYLGDLTPALTLLASVGVWEASRALAGRPRWRRGFVAATTAILVYSVGVGLLLAVTGYYAHFATHNPALYDWMRRHL